MMAGTPTATPIWVKQGANYHLRQKALTRERKLERLGVADYAKTFEKPVQLPSLGLHGFVDLVLTGKGEVCPVEFKLNDKPPVRGARQQLIAYGFALEEMGIGSFDRGFILCGSQGKTYKQERKENSFKELQDLVGDVRKALSSPFLPYSDAQKNKCTQCEYLAHCNDRV